MFFDSDIARSAERLVKTQAARQSQPAVDQALRVAQDSMVFSPAARSSVGKAVNDAVAKSTNQTVSDAAQFTSGSIDDLWFKGNDWEHNEIVDKAIAELQQAQHEVRIQTYTLDFQSESVDKLFKALAQKQQQNPNFKVFMVYGGELKIDPKSFAKTFNQTEMRAALQKYGVKADVASFLKMPTLGLDHSKSFLFDGEWGALGGVNIQNHPSKDLMAKVSGPVVDSMNEDFESAWADAKVRFRYDGKTFTDLGNQPLPAPVHGAPVVSPNRNVPMTMLTKTDRDFTFSGGHANDADQGLIAAINAAKTSIKLKTPNFNDPAVYEALDAAARRGVKIQMMTAKRFNQYRSIIDGANNDMAIQKFWAQLPEESRNNFEMRWFLKDGDTEPTNNDHTKYMSVDGVWSYIGSQNMDGQSWKRSREMGIGIDDAQQTQALDAQIFDGDWARAKQIPLPQQAKTSLG
ncbi:MAG TPA: phosphatidylserine/phosphatidylglycerophosphate/cardiolipin synthase family protein, partial [Oscillatoriaceae cyanobacterium]